eukprot:COSAG02_NODE_12899_length_1475_cov_0.914244_3_plen_194_part_00
MGEQRYHAIRVSRRGFILIQVVAYLKRQPINDTRNAGVYQRHGAHQTRLYGTIHLQSDTNIRYAGAAGTDGTWCSCHVGDGFGHKYAASLPLAFCWLFLCRHIVMQLHLCPFRHEQCGYWSCLPACPAGICDSCTARHAATSAPAYGSTSLGEKARALRVGRFQGTERLPTASTHLGWLSLQSVALAHVAVGT